MKNFNRVQSQTWFKSRTHTMVIAGAENHLRSASFLARAHRCSCACASLRSTKPMYELRQHKMQHGQHPVLLLTAFINLICGVLSRWPCSPDKGRNKTKFKYGCPLNKALHVKTPAFSWRSLYLGTYSKARSPSNTKDFLKKLARSHVGNKNTVSYRQATFIRDIFGRKYVSFFVNIFLLRRNPGFLLLDQSGSACARLRFCSAFISRSFLHSFRFYRIHFRICFSCIF